MYAIMRCDKLSTLSSVASSLRHSFRERETPNADASRTHLNEHKEARSTNEAMCKLREMLPAKRRKDAVLCIEYVLTASPSWWKTASASEQKLFFERSKKWLVEKYGAQNVIASAIHRDETSPHLHAYVVPLTLDGRLSAKEFVGDRKKMQSDQTTYAKSVEDLGLKRGIEKSGAKHTHIKKYYARTDAEFEPLPEILTPHPGQGPQEPESPGFFASRGEKLQYQSDFDEYERKLQQFETQKKQHLSELRAQREKAVEIALKHEARSRELEFVKKELEQQKKTISSQYQRIEKLERELQSSNSIASLFTREEVQNAKRRRQDEIESEQNRSRIASIEREAKRRCDVLPSLKKNASGALRTLCDVFERCASRRLNFSELNTLVAIESIGENGQPPDEVSEILIEFSPMCADPESHQEVKSWIERNAARLQAEFQYKRDQRSRDLQY